MTLLGVLVFNVLQRKYKQIFLCIVSEVEFDFYSDSELGMKVALYSNGQRIASGLDSFFLYRRSKPFQKSLAEEKGKCGDLGSLQNTNKRLT